MLLVATMMVPGEILIIPNYVTLADLGWINTYKALFCMVRQRVFHLFAEAAVFIHTGCLL